MTAPTTRLDLAWWPKTADEPPRYVFTLVNHGAEPLAGFVLAWNGHCKIDPATPLENATLLRRISNYTEAAPPPGFVLPPGGTWRFTVRRLNVPLRHWTEAAQAAFLIAHDGSLRAVEVGLCTPAGTPGTPRLGLHLDFPDATPSDGLAIIPWPRHVDVSGTLTPPNGLAIDPTHPAATRFAALCRRLFPTEPLLDPTGLPVHHAAADLPPEAYRLRFAPTAVTLEAGSPSGHLYGLITLGQILRAARRAPTRCRFPAHGTIEDAPHHPWRGAHLDVARQFYPPAELADFLAILAWNKLNRFHLHLTDDEAWRLDIAAYPDLARLGAWRGHGLPVPPLLGSGTEPHGGAYGKNDLRALVALAHSLAIEIVPEIDVPGHSYAALAALPWLRDPGENGEYWSIQSFPNNSLNPAVPAMVPFVETVLAELLDIFPSPWIHIGADEVPDDAWATSPLARARLAALGGRGASALQADLLRHLQRLLRRAGRITTAWDEGANAGGIAPDGALLMAWQDATVGPRLAAAGYDVVVAPAQRYYLNMALAPDWWEPGASWAGHASTADTYAFDPAAGFAAADLPRLAGVQCCIWSEQLHDRRVFHRLVFPRLSAVAETGWTAPTRKSWPRFAAAARFMPALYGQPEDM